MPDVNAQVVRSFVNMVWNDGAIDRAGEFIHPAYTVDGLGVGPAWVAGNVVAYRTAFPDLVMTVERLVADGEPGGDPAPPAGHPSRIEAGVRWPAAMVEQVEALVEVARCAIEQRRDDAFAGEAQEG